MITLVSTSAITFALAIGMIVPFDIYLTHSGSSTIPMLGVSVSTLYTCCCLLMLFYIFLLLPFAFFFVEEGLVDEYSDDFSSMHKDYHL